MTREQLAKTIDHTSLNPSGTYREIMQTCVDVLMFDFASICIPPYYVDYANEFAGKSNLIIGTVIGFPFGYSTTKIKMEETERAIFSGAREIDMLMNITAFKSLIYKDVVDDIKSVVNMAKGIHKSILVKVIIETCYLNDSEKKLACDLVAEGGADFVKTSTGFGSGGAKPSDIKLLKEHIDTRNYNLSIKASGGVSTLSNLELLLKRGANRIGTSNGDKIMREFAYREEKNAT